MVQKVTAKAMQKPEQVTRVVRSVTPTTEQTKGVGGYGSFNLNGRSIGAGGLPRPAYTIQEEGKIVINITVDPKGNVIFAEIGRGTNIDNASMRKSALDAAKRAKFNSISGGEQPERYDHLCV